MQRCIVLPGFNPGQIIIKCTRNNFALSIIPELRDSGCFEIAVQEYNLENEEYGILNFNTDINNGSYDDPIRYVPRSEINQYIRMLCDLDEKGKLRNEKLKI